MRLVRLPARVSFECPLFLSPFFETLACVELTDVSVELGEEIISITKRCECDFFLSRSLMNACVLPHPSVNSVAPPSPLQPLGSYHVPLNRRSLERLTHSLLPPTHQSGYYCLDFRLRWFPVGSFVQCEAKSGASLQSTGEVFSHPPFELNYHISASYPSLSMRASLFATGWMMIL